MTLSTVEIYTDGSAIRNPGMGGYAYIIRYTVDSQTSDMPEFKEIEFNQGYRYTTNNRMEMMAAIFGIRRVVQEVQNGTINGCSQINLFTDSELVCKSVNSGWLNKWMENNWMTSGFGGKAPQPVKNKDLWEEFIKARNEARDAGISITLNWVKGHDTNEMNNRADKLAVAASTGTDHIIDEGWEALNGVPRFPSQQ